MALRNLLRFSLVLFLFTSAAWTFADEPAKESYVPKAPLKKLDLQANDKTPQYQQALEVAHLNRSRNSGPVRNLRNEWRRFQRYARAKHAAQTVEARKEVAEMELGLEGLSERVAGHAADAKKLEDRIFAVNQPVPRMYVLTRVVAEAKKTASN